MDSTADEGGQDLCLACGICCSSTFFDTVQISDLQKLQRHEADGIVFELVPHDNGEPYFKLPCPAHRGGRCTIYEDRPRACIKFRCILLEAYTKNEIDFHSALEIVNNTKSREADIRRRIAELELPLKGGEIVFSLLYRAHEYWQKLEPGELKKKCGEIVLQIVSLRFYISKHFKDFEKKE